MLDARTSIIRFRATTLHARVSLVALALCLVLVGCGASQPPSLKRASVPPPPGPTLVVLGASDAFGIGTGDPDRENWPLRLATMLPQPIHLVNLAIPGATLAQAREETLPIALAQRPQTLVLWLVVNDIINNVPLSDYTAQLHATLAAIRAASPQTQIFVGNAPDLTQVPYFYDRDTAQLSAQITAWNVAIAQVCAAEGAHVADLYSAWGQFGDHPNYLSEDGLHPSDEGALALATFFDALIRQTHTPSHS